LGNPWVFQPGNLPETIEKRLPVMLRYLQLADQHIDATRLLFRIKNHTCRYLTGLPGSVKIRQQITECDSLMEIKALLE
jgi:tRNA-dihydrouridine synthase B